jgi:hypothetical protein
VANILCRTGKNQDTITILQGSFVHHCINK